MAARDLKSLVVAAYMIASLTAGSAFAAPGPPHVAGPSPVADSVLTPLQQRQTEQAVDRSLAWLASQQQPDGSFPTIRPGQPGVTGLCLLAFLSRGHLPGQGAYGDHINRAIDFILACQADDGMLSLGPIEPILVPDSYSQCGSYNHAIAALALSEAYGMAERGRAQKMKPAIEAAREFTLAQQRKPKRMADEVGGWRYLAPHVKGDSDLSVTSWQLLFLRSAKNAGFAVPVSSIDAASEYVQRSFNEQKGVFTYTIRHYHQSRGMVGAGILSMSLAGKHDSEMAKRAGQWVLRNGFGVYRALLSKDRYFIGVFYCTQGMFHLGGQYWQQFFPGVVKVLLDNQRADGSWDPEIPDERYGKAMSTAFCVLALNTPHQLLPIFQR